MLLGLLGLFSGNAILLFIAFFVYLGASSEGHAVQMRQATRGMLASDAMVTQFESLSPASRVEDAVQCLIRTTQHEFPVVDGGGRLLGLVTPENVGELMMVQAARPKPPSSPWQAVRRSPP